jgi:hypothetical protein
MSVINLNYYFSDNLFSRGRTDVDEHILLVLNSNTDLIELKGAQPTT